MFLGNFDGASVKGMGSYGWVIYKPSGIVHAYGGGYIGPATCNVAEYHGVIEILGYIRDTQITDIVVRGDSQLVIGGITGKTKISAPHLVPLNNKAWGLRIQTDARVCWVSRWHNEGADALAAECMRRRSSPYSEEPIPYCDIE